MSNLNRITEIYKINSKTNCYADQFLEIRHNFKYLTFKCRQGCATAIDYGVNTAKIISIRFLVKTYASHFMWENIDPCGLLNYFDDRNGHV
jgi:hypothetical protein